MSKVAVLGTTSWGTTLAVLLARNGVEVALICRSESEVRNMLASGENRRHRPGLLFPETLRPTAELDELNDVEALLVAVPSATLQTNLERVLPFLNPAATVISATKGIDVTTGARVSQTIESMGVDASRLAALSGPNFAGEIAAGLPAATVVAGPDAGRVSALQSLLNSPVFRVYTSNDLPGVELGGALKNVVAIACGLSDGLGYGDNARAALITRSLAEISRLGVAAGAQVMTFMGLAGIGDIILSCSSDQSRNRRLGLAIAKGQSLKSYIMGLDSVVEGAVTAQAVPVLTQRYGVEMPICEALHAVLYGGKPVDEAVRELMNRAARPEN
ncbi:MAG: NAD(P)H-dependent glycerol-3-phosphate dehydrogenase [Dehalococcoidia bacterium]